MDPREFSHAEIGRCAAGGAEPLEAADYRVEFRFSVRDARSLWAAAAAKALAIGLMTLEDVEDTLGPCEDPSIDDCIALLAEPGPVPGCTLTGFHVTRLSHDLGFDAAIAA